MTTLHPFLTSQGIHSTYLIPGGPAKPPLQNPSTHFATYLFVLLQGMLFTHIQLDDFTGTLAHFLERVKMEGKGIEEHDWVVVMSAINLGVVREYAKAETSGVISLTGGFPHDLGLNFGGGSARSRWSRGLRPLLRTTRLKWMLATPATLKDWRPHAAFRLVVPKSTTLWWPRSI